MYFSVLTKMFKLPENEKSKAFLVSQQWDDWFKYSTTYLLVLFDQEGTRHEIGAVKIGQFEMKENQRRPDIPDYFDSLDKRFFSLGQGDEYYDTLNKIESGIRDRVLTGLRDVALDLNLFERALQEDVTITSLLRSVYRNSVYGQYHRMAQGGTRLTRYKFSYTTHSALEHVASATLSYGVEPESYPPTNIHVLIGRNGVGKTVILNNMVQTVLQENSNVSKTGRFDVEGDDLPIQKLFSNLVLVAFSAFDSFEPSSDQQIETEEVGYAYIGLKHTVENGAVQPPKTPEQLSKDFEKSVSVCCRGPRMERWKRSLEMLEKDPIFSDVEIGNLATKRFGNTQQEKARELFSELSSGHKIVLLTITRLVETVGEKTLVLIDEPEAHLHPPLLSAFIRALSDLLIDRNGVAIVATHSPVVLQEVPKSCVWKIMRTGARVVAERPEIETFGENVGVLTREAFGLEVTHSGFHKMLQDAVEEGEPFVSIALRFGDELGGEARAIVRALIAARQNDVDL